MLYYTQRCQSAAAVNLKDSSDRGWVASFDHP